MNHRFPDPFDSRLHGYRGSSAVWRVTHHFSYLHPHHPIITVPTGTLTDGASVPKIFHSVLGPTGPYFRAAVIHDYLYSPQSDIRYKHITRSMADDIFYDAILDCWCRKATANVMWLAVRAGGWRPYKKPSAPIKRI